MDIKFVEKKSHAYFHQFLLSIKHEKIEKFIFMTFFFVKSVYKLLTFDVGYPRR